MIHLLSIDEKGEEEVDFWLEPYQVPGGGQAPNNLLLFSVRFLDPKIFHCPRLAAPVSQSAATLPIESCPLLAMRFLPADFPLALHQASTTHSYQVTAPRYCLPTEQSALPTPPSPPPLPLPLCLPPIGQWQ